MFAVCIKSYSDVIRTVDHFTVHFSLTDLSKLTNWRHQQNIMDIVYHTSVKCDKTCTKCSKVSWMILSEFHKSKKTRKCGYQVMKEL